MSHLLPGSLGYPSTIAAGSGGRQRRRPTAQRSWQTRTPGV